MQIDAGCTGVTHLTVELTEVGTSLMPYPRFREETAAGSCLADAIAEVNVFTKTHSTEAAQLLPQRTAHTHIKGAGIELVQFLLTATDATSSEERRHRVADGFLHRGEVGMRPVRTSEGITGVLRQLFIDSSKVTCRQYYIRVKDENKVALCPLCTIVTCSSRSPILLHIVM